MSRNLAEHDYYNSWLKKWHVKLLGRFSTCCITMATSEVKSVTSKLFVIQRRRFDGSGTPCISHLRLFFVRHTGDCTLAEWCACYLYNMW